MTQKKLEAKLMLMIFEFMKNLSKILEKKIILTGENSPKCPLEAVKPDGTLIKIVC